MNFSRTSRPHLSHLTFVFLGLAICVFTWGLQYKLSLYDAPNSASHQMPEAKLLSGNEQSKSVDSPLVEGTKAPPAVVRALFLDVFAAFLVAFALAYMAMASRRTKEIVFPWRLSCRHRMTAFFFRPPPVLI